MAMMAIPETFNTSNFSYHQREGGQHDFNSIWEFCYNALPFMFPAKSSSGINTITTDSDSYQSNNHEAVYTLDDRRIAKAYKGIFIINGKKVIK